MKSSAVAIFISILVSGCVGVGPITTITSTEKVGSSSYARVCPVPDRVGELTSCKAEDAKTYTAEKIIGIWGKPKSRGMKGDEEYLIYNRSIAWRGLLGFVVVPIPLLLPVGHNQTTFLFEQNSLIQTDYESSKSNIAVCGLHSEGPNGFGCRTGW